MWAFQMIIANLPYCLLPELNHAGYQVISFYGILM